MRIRHKRVLLPRRESDETNHLVYADLKTPHGEVKKVLCEVFLPTFKSKAPCFRFYPTAKQANFLQHIWAFDLTGKIRHAGRRITLNAKEVLSGGLRSGSFDGIPFFNSFDGNPLSIERTFSRGAGNGKRIVKGTFHLTACPVINTAIIVERSYTGEVAVKPVVVQSFILGSGLKLIFKKHFDTKEGKEKETITKSRLVAEFEATKLLPKAQFPEAVEELQEFLTLTSFASRYRCVCPRWDTVDEKGSITEHFQQNLVFPDSGVPGPEDTLVDIRDFMDFANSAFPLYRGFLDRSYVNNAMYALVGERSIVDDRFLVCFTALESLLLHVWHNSGPGTKNAKFIQLFNEFQKHYNLNISDLWPLVDRTRGRSLKDIRNRIAHGQPFNAQEEQYLFFAVENLKWLVERMLLAILKWPIEKSKVRKESLSYFTAHNWDRAITQFR